MNIREISLPQLRRGDVVSLNDDLVLTHTIRLWNLFQEPVRLNAYAIFVCMEGKLKITINDVHYEIKESMIAVNFPENVLCVEDYTNVDAFAVIMSPTCFNSLQFTPNLLSRIHLYFRSNVVFPIPPDDAVELYHYFTLMRYNATSKFPYFHEIINGLLHTGILQLFSLARSSENLFINKPPKGKEAVGENSIPQGENCAQNRMSNGRAAGRDAQIFSRFLACLADNCGHNRTVLYFASLLNLSPRYLTTLVKRYSGRSASEWIAEYVIIEAKRLITSTDKNFEQISRELNFPSQSCFGKYFKKYSGFCPRYYREKTSKY